MTLTERKQLSGLRIKLARTAAGFNQKQLAKKLSQETGETISHVSISRIEAGDRPVTVNEMRAIATILRQDRDWLEGYDGQPLVVDLASYRDIPRYRKFPRKGLGIRLPVLPDPDEELQLTA